MDARPVPVTRDPGLQPERTLAAWVRTCAALLVNALVLARAGLGTHGHPVAFALLAASGGIAGSALLLFLLSARRQKALLAERRYTAARAEVGVVSLLTIVIAASAAYLIFRGP